IIFYSIVHNYHFKLLNYNLFLFQFFNEYHNSTFNFIIENYAAGLRDYDIQVNVLSSKY
ncbi:hypothetical protein LCGC14_1021980, partial [marine sediment metagenome]